MDPMVSIIIPVYNAETTLRRCVLSVLGQQYEDFELLLIDDGSSDGSGGMCDEFARKDARVRVVHKKNAGVSAARNDAIRLARGRYLQFLDSDDWITPDATRLLVTTAQQTGCEMVVADFYRVMGERVSRKGDIAKEGVLTREEYAAYMMENPALFYYGVLWNKLYVRSIVIEHDLKMNEELRYCEDFLFNLEYMLHARTYCALQVPIYYYVKTRNSLTAQTALRSTLRVKRKAFACYNHFYKSVMDEEEYEKNRLKVYRFFVSGASDGKVPPVNLPGTKRLGDERVHLSPAFARESGALWDAYRERKLLQRALEPVALKHGISEEEAVLLWALDCTGGATRRDLADLTGTSPGRVALMLQGLAGKKLIRVEAEKGQLHAELLPAAQGVPRDLAQAVAELNRLRLDGLSEAERAEYERLKEKIAGNVQKAFREE